TTPELAVEIGNASDSSSFRDLRRTRIEIPANGTQRLVFTLASGAGALRARIGNDSLVVDNEVTLLPERDRPVRVEIGIQNEVLRELVESAMRATDTAELVPADPELLLTDE